MAHDVFVSYSNKDKNVANAIVAELEQEGIRCWIAPRDINPGRSWGEAINEAIEGSRFMVIVLSANSNQSRQVVREVERAVANNVIIIPFRIEDIDPTGAMAYFLSTEHWLDALTPPLEKHINKLAHAIKVFQGVEKADADENDAVIITRKKPFTKSKFFFPLLGIALIVILAIIFLPGLFNGNSENPDELSSGTLGSTGVSSQTMMTPTILITSTQTPEPEFDLLGTWSSSGSANNLFIQDDFTYIANGERGLTILDLSVPSDIQEVGSIELGNAQNVVVKEGLAYVTTQGGTLETTVEKDRMVIVDVRIPSELNILGEYTPEIGFVHRSLDSIGIEEQIVYLSFDDSLIAVDVSEPSSPLLLGEYSYESNIVNPGLVVQDSIVYLLTNQLHIVDFRDPQSPVELAGFDAGWGANLDILDERLYLSGWDSGLTILDISDPGKPIKIGSFMALVGDYELIPRGAASRQTFLDVSVDGDVAFLSYSFGLDQGTWTQVLENGIIAVDVSDPTNPELIGKYTNLDSVSSIFAQNNLVFITDNTRGLFVLRKPQWN